MPAPERPVPIPVWDLPVRLVHWALVALLAFQVTTAWIGGAAMAFHALSGYCILALAVFRVLWGFAGSTHARFADFVRGPVAVLRFAPRLLSREPVASAGHNPLGGWMVVALLAALLLQGLSGLFANDGLDFEGPLAKLVSFDASLWLSEFHRWNVRVVGVLVALHVLAVAFHWLVKGENLLGPMFTGRKRLAAGGHPPAVFPGPRRAFALLAVAAALVVLLVGVLP